MKRLSTIVLTAFALLSGSQFLHAQSRLHPDLQSIADDILADDAVSKAEIKDRLYKSLIFAFAEHNQADVIDRMIQRGEAAKIRDTHGNTLVHIAASGGNEELLSVLIAKGVQLDALNNSHRSALFEAANGNHLSIVKKLLAAGADVNGASKHYAPLNTAAWFGYTDIVRLLLSKGADVNRRDVDGNTALHKAVWQGQFQTVPFLLEAGAKKDVANDAGQTPMSMAKERHERCKKSGKNKRPWGTEQILGPPDAGNGYSQLEWCPSSAEGENEWLELFYDKPIVPVQVELYTKPTPQSVVKVSLLDDEGSEQAVWEGKVLKAAKGKPAHVSLIDVSTKTKTNRVKIYVNTKRVSGWIYYDAVGLIDADGKKHWATWAKASTCYAQGEMPLQKHKLVYKLLTD